MRAMRIQALAIMHLEQARDLALKRFVDGAGLDSPCALVRQKEKWLEAIGDHCQGDHGQKSLAQLPKNCCAPFSNPTSEMALSLSRLRVLFPGTGER